MIQSKTILFQQQQEIADQLNSYSQLAGKVEFVPENQKDIEFQIKKALGSQGIVGVVMTPKARYQGISYDKAQVWDLIDVTVQVIENPIVNRTLPEDRITALDAAVYASEAMSSPLHSKFGDYCPTQIEQGENGGLVVAQFKFSCTVRYDLKEWTRLYFDDGSVQKVDWSGEAERQMLEDALSASGHVLHQLAGVKSSSLVTGIGGETFRDADGLRWIDFTEALTDIGASAFQGCSNLQGVDVPGSVAQIGQQAFSGCTSLAQVNLHEGLTSIQPLAFQDCTSLSSFDGPDSLQDISWQTLAGCYNCKEFKGGQAYFGSYSMGGTFYGTTQRAPERIVVKEGVTQIGQNMFNGFGVLSDVQLPSTLLSVQNRAFNNCRSLVSVHLPDNLEYIGPGVFAGCSSLTSVNIPSGIDKLESSVFQNCNFTNIDLTSTNITSIGANAFQQCNSLESLEIPYNVISVGGNVCMSCLGLDSVVFNAQAPVSTRSFYRCPALQTVIIGDYVTSLSSQAFADCTSLKTLTIGSGLLAVNSRAFNNCRAVEDIYCYADPTALTWSTTSWTFKADGSTRVHVTADSLATWQANFGAANVTFVGDLNT